MLSTKTGAKVHKVQTKNVGRKVSVFKKLDEKLLYMRLNTIPPPNDAIANDVVYLNFCSVIVQGKAEPKPRLVKTIKLCLI